MPENIYEILPPDVAMKAVKLIGEAPALHWWAYLDRLEQLVPTDRTLAARHRTFLRLCSSHSSAVQGLAIELLRCSLVGMREDHEAVVENPALLAEYAMAAQQRGVATYHACSLELQEGVTAALSPTRALVQNLLTDLTEVLAEAQEVFQEADRLRAEEEE